MPEVLMMTRRQCRDRMKIILNQPQTFSEQGMKANQEDCVSPARSEMSASTRCFVLCDGMGGHEHGEVAAEIVSKSLYGFLTDEDNAPDLITESRFKNALAKTNKELDRMAVGEGKRPGTTMTCLYFGENGVLAAHIGDSRIYQIRPGIGIVFRTRDHSLVNELIRAGELTEEQAACHPRKNVITRAMQPGLAAQSKADVKLIEDVEPGDYFFMCSDGILEQITDKRLVEIVGAKGDSKSKIQAIFDECFGKTRDNYTCILIPVEKVEGRDDAQSAVTIPLSSSETSVGEKSPGKKRFIQAVIAISALLIVSLLVYYFVGYSDAPDELPLPVEETPDAVSTLEDVIEVAPDSADSDSNQVDSDSIPLKSTIGEQPVKKGMRND